MVNYLSQKGQAYSKCCSLVAHSLQTSLDPLSYSLLLTGDDEARHRGTQKSVLERKAPATFPIVIEMRERAFWVTHWTEDSVDCLLQGKEPVVQVDEGTTHIFLVCL